MHDDWDYSFNRYGYRGEEFDPNAKFQIAAFGCSYTFGNALKWEQTFAYRFKCLVAEHYGSAGDDVNLLNFAQGGASNDYISRTLLTQVSSFRPDLVLGYFTHKNRKEFVDGEHIYSLGPWSLDTDAPSEQSVNYYTYYSEHIGFIDSVRSILLAQYFLKARQIPYVFGWAGIHNLANPRFVDNPICRSYADLIDKTYFADFTLNREDFALDNHHPGPRANEIFARRLFDFCRAADSLEPPIRATSPA